MTQKIAPSTVPAILDDLFAYEKHEMYRGFIVADLHQMFSLFQDPQDWRAPIAVVVPGESVMMTVAAIEFFTATRPRVTLVQNAKTVEYLIESEDYRNGLAGDH